MNTDKNIPGKRFPGWIPVILIVLIILILGFMVISKIKLNEAAKKKALKKTAPPINVVTLKLSPKPIKERINLPGVVKPWLQVLVSAESSGLILEKRIIEGTKIQKGGLIAVIDSTKYLNAYNASKASYTATLASKKRLETLYSSKLSSKSDLDAITARLANDYATMKIAALNLEKCTIKAPVSGIVNDIYIEKGNFIDIGAPVAEIIQIDRVKVNVGIPESDVSAVRKLTEFRVSFDALDGQSYQGKKYFLSKTTASLARLYDLDIVIDNPNHNILPGMFGRIDIVKHEIENAISVPLYAVISRDNKNIVYIAQNNIACKRVVETGLQEGWMLEITKGLNENEEVIVVGQRNVSDNQNITILKSIRDPEELAQ